ncbi:glycosyltransferase family 4 protein [Tolypothrix sp. PCC 7910]|uniref:glycosyltransferase family 4 protein n=1 Tax=Tolypothrix sp. PCC 7910 TaxID=2099387 RepID=UPI0014277C60|nr:glycosyltransferase family 1 protein [Tolypothrix sp. PCC 7910]QIR38950.1 glycosyltransferase family 4 protein [Tolypothrix sp. PCC 7910]
MNLQGINVLIDGYNLELKQGTGIKTYGITLVQALSSMGVNVDILCSRYTNNRDSLLSEALFFDTQSQGSKFSQIKNTILALSQNFYKAKKLSFSNFVIKQESDFIFEYFIKSGEIFNISGCYNTANNLSKLLKIETKINIDKKIDIWHATYPLPIKVKNAKKITTIHDLIPIKLPYATLDDKSFFCRNIQNSIKNSEIILTISENTKKDILECFDVEPNKIYVTYQPMIDKASSVDDDVIDVILKKYNLNYKKYILFVGAIEPKKNLGRLIDAYSELDSDIPLVIVGKKGWLWESEIGKLETVFADKLAKKVKLLEYLPRKELNYLYKGAFCFVFPSLYEGFGLPPLEAMSFGCPVITSNVSSLPEVCGEAALYVDPYNSEEIRQAIENLMNNPQLPTQLSKAGKERVELFSLENYSKKIYEAYTKIL